ncbi:MAG: hypothetical protein A3E36_03445 [Candidatus Andersenbacteria bacterium RIFCSPHIGHO2_12_FULL_45_11b]|uniref:Uncharacterized protein n=1 Tax=Candidatus Andersenbacteria bacterium RIFCSPHIGHO2_12_FULL_45_11b TaxID=1797282 RepID=A0A1G1XB61_9BACT|nr:MAG: hypothetical protein A3E36_03445 [Candidatus Andersenbacteria bacterium RIFCSPHIGHO2_12_FULL_45_11b]
MAILLHLHVDRTKLYIGAFEDHTLKEVLSMKQPIITHGLREFVTAISHVINVMGDTYRKHDLSPACAHSMHVGMLLKDALYPPWVVEAGILFDAVQKGYIAFDAIPDAYGNDVAVLIALANAQLDTVTNPEALAIRLAVAIEAIDSILFTSCQGVRESIMQDAKACRIHAAAYLGDGHALVRQLQRTLQKAL